MAITIKDVEHVAALAHLSFTEEEKQRLVVQLNDVLRYMEQLNKLDTSNVEPLLQVVETTNEFRDDVLHEMLSREDALKNAPSHTEKFFTVPKVIGGR